MSRLLIVLLFSLGFNLPIYCADTLTDNRNMSQASELSNRGKLLRDQGKLQESLAVLEKACLLDPNRNSGIVHENLAMTLEKMGYLEQAKVEYLKAHQFNPDRSAILYSLANCYMFMGDTANAIVYWKEFLDREPSGPYSNIARRVLTSLQEAPKTRDNPNAGDYFDSAITVDNKITKWPAKKQPITIFIEADDGVDGYQPLFRRDIINALDKWTKCSNGRLSWRLVASKQNADVVCHWSSDRNNFRQPDSADISETRLKYSPNLMYKSVYFIVSGDIVFCTKNIDDTPVTNEQMQFACLHEIGHVLGIQGHSANKDDVMFYRERNMPMVDLSERDKATLIHLYSAK